MMGQASVSAGQPGRLTVLVGAALSARGLGVSPASPPDRQRLLITGLGAGELSVDDYGQVQWEYGPAPGREDPKQVADLATVLLTGTGAGWPRLGNGYDRPGITFKGIAGLELRARGFTVVLDICTDEEVYHVTADIVVTAPGTSDHASVRIGDDGALTWERDFGRESAARTALPGQPAPVLDPAGIADDIVTTIVRAAALLQGGRDHGPEGRPGD